MKTLYCITSKQHEKHERLMCLRVETAKCKEQRPVMYIMFFSVTSPLKPRPVFTVEALHKLHKNIIVLA